MGDVLIRGLSPVNPYFFTTIPKEMSSLGGINRIEFW
jgi:hypothetical protein